MAEVRIIGIIGAGAAGSDIAQASALAGYRTILEDILPASLRRAATEIKAGIDQAVAAFRITNGQAASALARIDYASSVEEAARQADLVIEAVPDELESKTEIFTLLDKVCRPQTMIASNTSAFSIAEIAAVTYRPGKCLAMRFRYPVREMGTLEIVRGPETDEETIAACSAVARKMGMAIRVVADGIGRLPELPKSP
jgi:3-hydroxybutyryl-CoA dehydrogenase